MAGFLYYFPKSPNLVPSKIPSECELSFLKDMDGEYSAVGSKGPDGDNGFIISCHPSPDKIGYYPESQTWEAVEHPTTGVITHWIGVDNNQRPCPEDLLKRNFNGSDKVRLGDDNFWIIPIVEAYSKGLDVNHIWLVTLPKHIKMSRLMETKITVVPGYEELIALGAKWRETIYKGGKYDQGDFWRFLAALLAVNYRVGRAEINMLGIAMDDNGMNATVVKAALGIYELEAEEEAQKKMGDIPHDTLSSSNGEPV
jgi:hypothetical protein